MNLSYWQQFVLTLLDRAGGEVPARDMERRTDGLVNRRTFTSLIKRDLIQWLTPPPDHSNVFRYRITNAGREALIRAGGGVP
jgi:hypothetical protein